MQPKLVRKLSILAFSCVFTSLAGVVVQLVNQNRINYNSILLGFPLGLAFGILELMIFSKYEQRFSRWSFTRVLLFKTVLYTAAVYFVSACITVAAGFFQGRNIAELPGALLSLDRFVLVVYALVVYGLLLFYLQVNYLLGDGILWKFLRGKYHRPREEERIFMFLDMKSSTTIAEHLGHERFYTLLNEVFREITQPVIETKAQIYQYVGDEVVLTWEVEHGLKDSNCLKSFFMFKESLLRNSERYLQDFGIKPEFKAGLHFGKVISAQIGDLKREIVYNGDVLNTTARIQNECNKYQKDCLVSGALMNRLRQMKGFQWEWVDTIMLRGKGTEVDLYSPTIRVKESISFDLEKNVQQRELKK